MDDRLRGYDGWFSIKSQSNISKPSKISPNP
jgi:hypothetical protein